MGNASDLLKSIAHEVAASVDQDGSTYIIERCALNA
jgi:hydroxymethylpyrimidine pyrophosphatase-like HAD family hydrolase